MSLSRWNAMALIPTAALVLCGGFLLNEQTSAQTRQDVNLPEKAASVVSQRPTANARTAKIVPLVVPAIQEPRAAAGKGKALVYALDENGRRIPTKPGANKRRRRQERGDQDGGKVIARPPEAGPDKEVVVDLSWAAVTGVVNQRAIESRLANSDPVGRMWAERVYRRVELERQDRSPTGAWSDWQAVDPEPTLRFLDNVPEVDFERTPEELRLANLVDLLPYLKDGEWKGVDVERFVPAVNEKRAVAPIGGPGGHQAAKGRLPERPLPPLLMVRQLDFTVHGGRTYRYRARLVVDDYRLRGKEVASAWSEPTQPVTVP